MVLPPLYSVGLYQLGFTQAIQRQLGHFQLRDPGSVLFSHMLLESIRQRSLGNHPPRFE